MKKALKITQERYQEKAVTEELEELQRDRKELNQILMLVKRCSVKEVILSEIHLVSAEIDSLLNPTLFSTDSITRWTDVTTTTTKTKTKTNSNTNQNNTYQIPVVNNRYNLLSLSEGCDSEMDSVNGDQQTEGGEEYNKKESDIRRNKIIIPYKSDSRWRIR